MRVGPQKVGSPGAHSYEAAIIYREQLSFQAPAPAAPRRYTEQRSPSMTSSARGFTLERCRVPHERPGSR